MPTRLVARMQFFHITFLERVTSLFISWFNNNSRLAQGVVFQNGNEENNFLLNLASNEYPYFRTEYKLLRLT